MTQQPKKNFATLLVGASYEDGDAGVHNILDKSDTGRFKSDTGFWYTSDGYLFTSKQANVFNLIRVLPDADGWYPHVPGDPCPVDEHTVVEYRLARGSESKIRARELDWSDKLHEGSEITSYRIISEPDAVDAADGPVITTDRTPEEYKNRSAREILEDLLEYVSSNGFDSGFVARELESALGMMTPDPELSAIQSVMALPDDRRRAVVAYLVGRV